MALWRDQLKFSIIKMGQRKGLLSTLLLVIEIIWAILYTIPVLMKKLYHMLSPRPLKNLYGKKVLITGATQGIGKGLAIRFAALGCKVLCVDVNTQACEKTAEQIGKNAQAFTCDVSNPEEVANLMKKTGPVDILINNTIVITYSQFLETDQQLVNQTIDVNVKANFWILRHYLPEMLKKDEGQIVLISSVAGLAAPANMGLYSTTRFAVVGLMESLYEELRLKRSNVKLTCVCPYFVRILNSFDTSLKARISPMDTSDAVEEIMSGIREERFLFSVPWYFEYFIPLNRLFPKEVQNRLRDTMYVHLEGSATNLN